jgi:hypothetical protein
MASGGDVRRGECVRWDCCLGFATTVFDFGQNKLEVEVVASVWSHLQLNFLTSRIA